MAYPRIPALRILWTNDVAIVCPGCGRIVHAIEVLYAGDPWTTYLHECRGCGFMIMESDWEYAP